MFITYDLPSREKGVRKNREAIEVSVPGQVARWRFGNFEDSIGRKHQGVRLTLALDDEQDVEHPWIELPEGAYNVQLHLNQLPEAYRPALKKTA